MDKLDRFRQAQDAPHAGYTAALRELQAGEKTGHWIWYVFPQLAGLGQSSTAVYYGLAGVEEAAAYLRDRVLGERLVTAAAAVRAHLSPAQGRPIRLARLMGSEIDVLKLVSSMTLFGHVAETLVAADPQPRFVAMAAHAAAILGAAAAQGYAGCAYTEAQLR
jgi:uncharacterized protein (DUF1810 family)